MAQHAMDVKLGVSGLSATLAGFQQLAAQMKAVAQAHQAMQGGAGGSGGGGGSPRVPRSPGGGGFLGGPFQRLQKAQANFQKAVQSGNAAIMNDAELQLKQAHAAVQKITQPQGSTFGQRFARFAASTRFGVGAGGKINFMPLLGRTGELAGEGAGEGAGLAVASIAIAVATLKLAIAPLVLEIKGFVGAIKAAADAGREFREAMLSTGGTTRNIAFLKSVGADPGQAAGLRSNLASSPFAQIAAQRLGLGVTLPRQLAPGMNEANLQENIIRGLAGIESASDRWKNAVLLDAEALLPSVEFYRRHKEQVDADSNVLQKIQQGGFGEAASDLLMQADRIKTALLNIVFAFAKPFLQPIQQFLGVLADQLQLFAGALADFANQGGLQPVVDLMKQFTIGALELGKGLAGLIQWIGSLTMLLPGGQQMGQQQMDFGKSMFQGLNQFEAALMKAWAANVNATQANTNAVNDNTAAVNAGTFGGGARTRRALGQKIPGLLPPGMFDAAVAGGAYRLGAI